MLRWLNNQLFGVAYKISPKSDLQWILAMRTDLDYAHSSGAKLAHAFAALRVAAWLRVRWTFRVRKPKRKALEKIYSLEDVSEQLRVVQTMTGEVDRETVLIVARQIAATGRSSARMPTRFATSDEWHKAREHLNDVVTARKILLEVSLSSAIRDRSEAVDRLRRLQTEQGVIDVKNLVYALQTSLIAKELAAN